MGINWFTVIAQIINFLILVWLLKKFLYKPVLKAIDEREKKIVAQLNDAKAKMEEAEKEKKEFQKKNEDFDQQRAVQLNQMEEEVKAEKQKLLDEARSEFKTLRSKLEEELNEEQQHINRELRLKTLEEVFAVADKALKDLASVSLEEQSVNVFVKRLQSLKEEEQQQFKEALNSKDHTVVIKSAYNLPDLQRSRLEQAIKALTNEETSFQFQTVPDLISGIEMNVQNYQLSWNIEAYLKSLQKHITASVIDMHKEEENVTV